jgi:MoxR-like ATPase
LEQQQMNDKSIIVNALRTAYGDVVTRQQISEWIAGNPQHSFPNWLCNDQQYRAGRGMYRLPVVENGTVASKRMDGPRTTGADGNINYTAEAVDGYVPFGNHDDIVRIIKSRMFHPVFISGLSGCGKTTTVQQVCHELNREYVRVNITIETDEDDLLGGFRLIDGDTVFSYGPVVEAMRRGAVLLLDEVDLASSKIMCLQPVLEGKGVMLKKIGEYVIPAPGFTIIATANTKGQGSETGKFVGTNVLNEAFIDRFAETMDQEYPVEKVETRIIRNAMRRCGADDDAFVANLVTWANAIRRTYAEGACDEVISTRRLVYVAEAFGIYGDRIKAIESVVRRFTAETRESMLSLYQKVDSTINGTGDKPAELVESVEIADGTVPF